MDTCLYSAIPKHIDVLNWQCRGSRGGDVSS